jgi:hypothetical protein
VDSLLSRPSSVNSVVNNSWFCSVYETFSFLRVFVGVIGYFDGPNLLFDTFPTALMRIFLFSSLEKMKKEKKRKRDSTSFSKN